MFLGRYVQILFGWVVFSGVFSGLIITQSMGFGHIPARMEKVRGFIAHGEFEGDLVSCCASTAPRWEFGRGLSDVAGGDKSPPA